MPKFDNHAYLVAISIALTIVFVVASVFTYKLRLLIDKYNHMYKVEFGRLNCGQLRDDLPLLHLNKGEFCYIVSYKDNDPDIMNVWAVNSNNIRVDFVMPRSGLIIPSNSTWNLPEYDNRKPVPG